MFPPLPIHFGSPLALETTTALSVPTAQVPDCHDHGVTTVTQAAPACLIAPKLRLSRHRAQAAEPNSSQVKINRLLPTVPPLHFRCRPSYIAWFIVTVIVSAVQGMSLTRAASNICVECKKAVPPAITDGDPTSTIVPIGRRARIETTLFHRAPYRVGGKFLNRVRNLRRHIHRAYNGDHSFGNRLATL